MKKSLQRERLITRTSLIGIFTNLALVGTKMLAGLVSGSIAIILDAVNNLTDVLSSIVTLVGTKLANRRPDKIHPHGHGRLEYLATLIVTIVIFLTGLTAIKESVAKIIDPGVVEYSFWTLAIVAVAVIVKIFLSSFVKHRGQEADSSALIASGQDALMDAILSFATLVAGILNLCFGWKLEGWLGIVIAIFIIKTALTMMSEAVATVLGQRANTGIINKIQKRLLMNDQVQAVYDLTLHDYGPNHLVGAAKIQIPSHLTAPEIHKLTRKLEVDLLRRYGVAMIIGIYAQTPDDDTEAIWQTIKTTIKSTPEILQVHGLLVDHETKTVYYDVVIDWQVQDPAKIIRRLAKELKVWYPDYTFVGQLDPDVSVSQ